MVGSGRAGWAADDPGCDDAEAEPEAARRPADPEEGEVSDDFRNVWDGLTDDERFTNQIAPAIERLRRAVEDRGPCPDIHLEIMRRHRREWPTLWAAIDEVLRPVRDP